MKLDEFRIKNYPIFEMAHIVSMVQSRITEGFGDKRINASSWRVISIISEQAPITIKKLSHEAIIERPSLSRIADRLESYGLIERKPNPDDNRSSLLILTSAGENLYQKISSIAAQVMEETFGHLGREKNLVLRKLIQEIYHAELRRQ